jgi:hypothetical protein
MSAIEAISMPPLMPATSNASRTSGCWMSATAATSSVRV